MNVIVKGAILGALAGVGIGGAWAFQADDTVDVAVKRTAAVGGAAAGAGLLVGAVLCRRGRRQRAVDQALAKVLGTLGLTSHKKHLSRRARRQLRRFDVGKLDISKLDVGAITGNARRRAGKAAGKAQKAAGKAAEVVRDRAAEAADIARQRAAQATGAAVEVARRRSPDAAGQTAEAVSDAWGQAQADDLLDRAATLTGS